MNKAQLNQITALACLRDRMLYSHTVLGCAPHEFHLSTPLRIMTVQNTLLL